MSTAIDTDRVLEPIENTTWKFWILFSILLLGVLVFLNAWVYQLTFGLYAVTALDDWGITGGIPWGLYIGGFVWWVGIAHGGIAISAAVRVLDIERFKPIGRIAEVLTVLALAMSGLSIVLDLARPDRIFNTIYQWPFTVQHSPLAWDITVITLYLVLSLTYLTLSLRAEIHAFRDRLPRYFGPVYALVTLGYSHEEDEKIEQILWWLAITILALVPLLSGGVVPWLFSSIGAQPGWFGAGAGAAILTESLTSALAVVIIVSAVFRWVYDWEDIIEDRIFHELAVVLAFFGMATVWFILHDVLTGFYLAPAEIQAATTGELELTFFHVAILGLVFSVVSLLVMIAFRDRFFSLPALVVVSGLLAVTILNKKVMFVVEGLLHPTQPPLTHLYPTQPYFPTLVEWVLFSSTIVLAAFGFLVFTKVIPMIELDPEEVK